MGWAHSAVSGGQQSNSGGKAGSGWCWQSGNELAACNSALQQQGRGGAGIKGKEGESAQPKQSRVAAQQRENKNPDNPGVECGRLLAASGCQAITRQGAPPARQYSVCSTVTVVPPTARVLPHSTYLRNMMQLLWPPNPKLLDSATSISTACFSLPTTMLRSTASSGVSRLRLGCTKPASAGGDTGQRDIREGGHVSKRVQQTVGVCAGP